MTLADFDAFCASLPAATFVAQWGGAHVWKVGGKVFAIGGTEGAYSFKATPIAFEALKSEPGVRPAPYLASRGLSWLQWIEAGAVSEEELRGLLRQSHSLVVAGLSRRARSALSVVSGA